MLLLGSTVASLICIAGFFYYLRDHAEQISGIVDRLADDLVSLTQTSTADMEE